MTPGFTAEASLQELRQKVSSLARLHRQDGIVHAAMGTPGTTQANICVLLPYFPELEPLCCTWIRDRGVSCMCQCKYSTGSYAPPNNVCSGPPDSQCLAACQCLCYGWPPGCSMMGIK